MAGRIDRRLYVIYTMAYLALFALLRMAAPGFPTVLVLPFFWMPLVAARRLRDVGRSGWWALTPLVVGFAQGFTDALAHRMAGLPQGTPTLVGQVLLAAGLLITVSFLLWLGFKKGDAGPNRFGDAALPY